LIVYKAVRYKNFFATGNQFTEINLNQNKTTLIVGDNGAGKSTVLEAISYAMYGRPMRSVTKPLMINSINNKNMLVELEFSVGQKNYMIRRGMKPNVFEIFIDGNLINQDSASKDYQEVLETQILKRNHKSFCQIDVLSMANYTPFMKLTAAGRREVIEDLLDIEIFSLMNTLLKDKITTNKEDYADADYQIKLIDNNIVQHQQHIIEMNLNHQETIDAKLAQIAAYNTEVSRMDSRIQEVFNEIQTFTEQTKTSATVRKKLSSKISTRKTITDKTEYVKKDIAFYETNTSCPTCKQEIDESFKVGEINKKQELLEEAEKTVLKLESSILTLKEEMAAFEVLNEQISDLNKEASELTIKISTNQRFMSSIQAEIKSLEAKITEAHTDNIIFKDLTEQLTKANERKETLTKEREVLSMAGQLLKDGGIKSKIIKQYVPVMNQLINRYLAEMDFLVQFELDETFKETIKSRFRDEFSYDSFSQGEKLRIDIALLFAWRAIAKMKNSSATNLLFMDEILDSSLDAGGVDEFLKIIRKLADDTNVFIISHRGDQMVDKFEHTIKFQKVKNFSRIAA